MPNLVIKHNILLELQKIARLVIVCNDTMSNYFPEKYTTTLCWTTEQLQEELQKPNLGRSAVIFYFNKYELSIHDGTYKDKITLSFGSEIEALLEIKSDEQRKIIEEYCKKHETN